MRHCCTGNCNEGRDCPVASPEDLGDAAYAARVVLIAVVCLLIVITAASCIGLYLNAPFA